MRSSASGLLVHIAQAVALRMNDAFELWGMFAEAREDSGPEVETMQRVLENWATGSEENVILARGVFSKLRHATRGECSNWMKVISAENMLLNTENRSFAVNPYIPVLWIMSDLMREHSSADKIKEKPIFRGGNCNGKGKQLVTTAGPADKRSHVFLHPVQEREFNDYEKHGGFRIMTDTQMEINPWTESDNDDHRLVITDLNLMFRLLFKPSVVIDKNNPILLKYNEIEQDFRIKLAEGGEICDLTSIEDVEDEAEESDGDEPTSAKKPPAAPSVDLEECRARMINIANRLVDMSVTLDEFGLDDLDFKKKQRELEESNADEEQQGTGDIDLGGTTDGNTSSNTADAVEHNDEVSDDDNSSTIDNNERIVNDMKADMESLRDDWDNIQKEMVALASLLTMKPSGDTLLSILHDDIYQRLKSMDEPDKSHIKELVISSRRFPQNPYYEYDDTVPVKWNFWSDNFGFKVNKIPSRERLPVDIKHAFRIIQDETQTSSKSFKDIILNKPIDSTTAQTSIYQSYEVWCGPDKKWICNIDILRQRGVKSEKMLKKVDSIVWLLKDSWSKVETVLESYEKK